MDTFNVIVLVATAVGLTAFLFLLEGQSLRRLSGPQLRTDGQSDDVFTSIERLESAMNQGVGAFPPPFVVNRTRLGATLNLAVAGELDASNAPELRAEIFAVGTDWARLVIDLTDLTFIDSVGLSTLVAAKKLSREQRFELFVIPSEHDGVRRVFELTETGEALRQDPDDTPLPTG
jgi:anti-sigma B factor antagonist